MFFFCHCLRFFFFVSSSYQGQTPASVNDLKLMTVFYCRVDSSSETYRNTPACKGGHSFCWYAGFYLIPEKFNGKVLRSLSRGSRIKRFVG